MIIKEKAVRMTSLLLSGDKIIEAGKNKTLKIGKP